MAADLYRLTETERKLANTVLKGAVVAVDPATAKIKVKSGGITTGWIPWLVTRAGGDRTWTAPEIGEQVAVMCPSGRPSQGVAVGALYSTAAPAPADSLDKTTTVWSDGASLTYDRAAHAWTLDVPAGGAIVLKVAGTSLTVSDAGVAIVGDVTVTGSINASGAIIDAAGNTSHHSH